MIDGNQLFLLVPMVTKSFRKTIYISKKRFRGETQLEILKNWNLAACQGLWVSPRPQVSAFLVNFFDSHLELEKTSSESVHSSPFPQNRHSKKPDETEPWMEGTAHWISHLQLLIRTEEGIMAMIEASRTLRQCHSRRTRGLQDMGFWS